MQISHAMATLIAAQIEAQRQQKKTPPVVSPENSATPPAFKKPVSLPDLTPPPTWVV